MIHRSKNHRYMDFDPQKWFCGMSVIQMLGMTQIARPTNRDWAITYDSIKWRSTY